MLKRPDPPASSQGNNTSSAASVSSLYSSLQATYERRYGVARPIEEPSTLIADASLKSEQSAKHLEYGSSGPSKAQPEYRANCMPYRRGRGRPKGLQFRSVQRLELIARLENAGISEFQIATMLTISVPRLRSIKRSPDYLRARVAITHGIIIDTEGALADIKEQRKEILTQMLPPALRVIANAVTQRPTSFPERALQIRVAQDILDREGTYAKISRSEIRPVDKFDWSTAETSAREVISIVRGVSVCAAEREASREAVLIHDPAGSMEVQRLIEITRAFNAGQMVTPSGAESAMKVIEMVPAGAQKLGSEDQEG